MPLLDIIILMVAALACAYHQVKPLYWTIIIGVTLLILTAFGQFGILAIFAWAIYLVAAIYALAPTLRKRYVTQRVMRFLQKRMPSISETEKEAIESGDVWWEKELFCGTPNWSKLLAYPKPTLTQEEQNFLDNQVETLCGMLDDWQIVRYDNDLPKKVWDYLKHEKFFGLVIPKEYGGLGFSALLHSTTVVKVATRSISATINMMVPNSLGPGELLVHYGTPAQKSHYLPRLAKGEEVPCFALTGPDAGSDASSIPDTGIVCHGTYQGKNTLGIRLNWDKRYITLAPIATVLGLAIHLYDPEHLLGEKEDVGITLCLIPTSHEGVEIGRRHLPLYLAFMNGPTQGKNVFIPLDWIIGGPEMAGRGWHMLMECLSIGRSISLPGLSVGVAKLAYYSTGAYARIRKQFNLPIGYFEGVEEMLSHIAGLTYILEATRVMTAGAVDQKIKPAIASAIAKYHTTELGRKIVNHAMDVHAGHTIQTGPHNNLANVYLAMPMSITVEGANALTRNLIIFGQGSICCHPYLLREVELLASSSPQALDEFDTTLMSHINYVLGNFARTVWYGLTGAKFIATPAENSLKPFYQQITRVSSAFAFISDLILLILGGNLKRRERISARLGDILSQMYLASAVLKYFKDQGRNEDELPYVKWSVQTCLYDIQTTFRDLTQNFPIKWLGKILYWIIFPYGASYAKPDDKLSQQIVSKMLTPSALRDRLTQNMYITKNPKEWAAQLEDAFRQVAEVDPIAKKFQNAVRHGKVPAGMNFAEQIAVVAKDGLLTDDEVRTLQAYEKLRQDIIKVSEFSFDLYTVVN